MQHMTGQWSAFAVVDLDPEPSGPPAHRPHELQQWNAVAAVVHSCVAFAHRRGREMKWPQPQDHFMAGRINPHREGWNFRGEQDGQPKQGGEHLILQCVATAGRGGHTEESGTGVKRR